jgi:hypothetical protein
LRGVEESKRLMKKPYLFAVACVLILAIAYIPKALCTYPPAGVDTLTSTLGSIDLQILGPGGFEETIKVSGPTNVSRGNPYDDGTHRIKIDTEIIFMSLTGNSKHVGPITVVQSPSIPSKGAIQQISAGQDFPASSFFLLYIEIHVPALPFPNNVLHNNKPKNMSTIIFSIPPTPNTVYEGPATIDLYNANNDTVIGHMLSTSHTVFPVGGIAIPIDKLVLLAPYIGLASTITVGAAASAFYVKRVKHRKEKQ